MNWVEVEVTTLPGLEVLVVVLEVEVVDVKAGVDEVADTEELREDEELDGDEEEDEDEDELDWEDETCELELELVDVGLLIMVEIQWIISEKEECIRKACGWE